MLNGLNLTQHVVEFIRGTGLVTDGVVDATSTTGPWTWTMPRALEATIDACGAGGGGAGGGSPTGGGGGGGGSGRFLVQRKFHARPGDSVSVTCGSKGTGGAAGAAGLTGSDTSISINGVSLYVVSSAKSTSTPGGAANGGAGGQSGNWTTGGAGGTGAAGSNTNTSTSSTVSPLLMLSHPGAGGGAVNYNGGRADGLFQVDSVFGAVSGGTGNATNGGGGAGGRSVLLGDPTAAPCGAGGAGGSAGSAAPATSYGAGGGGGGGGAAGGDGADGYVRITYWSID